MGLTCFEKKKIGGSGNINNNVGNNNIVNNQDNNGMPNENKITTSEITRSEIGNVRQTFRSKDSGWPNKSKTNITNETLLQFNIEKNVQFPPGEQFYRFSRDNNVSEFINKNNSLSQKIELFFSLNEIEYPSNRHSFSISIINSKRTGIVNFLGKLDEQCGENIEFGHCFEIDYFFERVQKIIIEPLVNGNKTGQKEEFFLSKLMTSREGKIDINIENIGKLEIRQQKKENNELNTKISCFQFIITLDNDIFKTSEYLEKVFYVIRNIKDGKTRRPVYKSHEYNFKLKESKQTSWIKLDSDFLCNNNIVKYFLSYILLR